MNTPKNPKSLDSMQPVLSSSLNWTHPSIHPPWEAAGMTAGKPCWICLKWKLVWKKKQGKTHTSSGYNLTPPHTVCLCLHPPAAYILIPSGSLFTPPAGSGSHVVDHPWPRSQAPGCGWHEKARGGPAHAHPQTLARRNVWQMKKTAQRVL